jgi:tetratricopeptide (TPR) repeat protein
MDAIRAIVRSVARAIIVPTRAIYKALGYFFFKLEDSNQQERWYTKLLVRTLSGCIIAFVGLFISYQLFVIEARHQDELYSFKDGNFYAARRMGQEIKGLYSYTLIDKRYFDHWKLCKNGVPITSPRLLETAVEETTEGIWRSPKKIRLYWLRGLALFKLGQYDLAIIDFRHVYYKFPHFVNAGLAMAIAY